MNGGFVVFFNMHCHCSRNFHFPFLLATAGERRQIFGQKRNCTAAKRFLRLRPGFLLIKFFILGF